MRVKVKNFTLLEVVFAVAILAISLMTLLGIMASVSKRMVRANERWHGQHALTQALEYYLLTGETSSPRNDVFPYEDYSCEITISEPENLPEGVKLELDKWKLIKVSAKLKDLSGKVVEYVDFDKIIKEDGATSK